LTETIDQSAAEIVVTINTGAIVKNAFADPHEAF
jgi:hypothetical protein